MQRKMDLLTIMGIVLGLGLVFGAITWKAN